MGGEGWKEGEPLTVVVLVLVCDVCHAADAFSAVALQLEQRRESL